MPCPCPHSYVNDKSVTISDPKLIRLHYLSTEFTLDLVASWPHDLIALWLGVSRLSASLLRLIKVLNLRYVIRAYDVYNKKKAGDRLLEGLVQYTALILLTTHYGAIGYIAFGFDIPALMDNAWPKLLDEAQQFVDGQTFFAPAGMGDPQVQLAKRYVAACYFIISLLTTVGMQFLPANVWEMCFNLLVLLLNMTVYAYAVGQISALVMKQDDEMVRARRCVETAAWCFAAAADRPHPPPHIWLRVLGATVCRSTSALSSSSCRRTSRTCSCLPCSRRRSRPSSRCVSRTPRSAR